MRENSYLAQPVLLSEPRGGVPDIIDTKRAFNRMIDAFASASGPIAADAERASGYRYGHKDRLVQFKREGAGIALIDPVALESQRIDWNDFNEAAGDAVWIIHDAMQDLPGFAELGLCPKKLFDTEFASRLLGMKRNGLSFVTEHYLGMTLAKEHSAADWSYRPLGRDMRNYAALDVEVLEQVMEKMNEDIISSGKSGWAEEEFDYILKKGLQGRKEYAEPWRRVSKITVLGKDRRGLAVVRELWTERDKYAREYDISPSLLLSDSAIIEAAVKKPRNAKQFSSVRSLNTRVRIRTDDGREKMFERYAPIQRKIKPRVWKEAIQRALALPESSLPLSSPRGSKSEYAPGEEPAPKSVKYWRENWPDRYEKLEKARQITAQISQDTHTPADILLKPAILRNLCWNYKFVSDANDVRDRLFRGGARAWQTELLSESLTRVIM